MQDKLNSKKEGGVRETGKKGEGRRR